MHPCARGAAFAAPSSRPLARSPPPRPGSPSSAVQAQAAADAGAQPDAPRSFEKKKTLPPLRRPLDRLTATWPSLPTRTGTPSPRRMPRREGRPDPGGEVPGVRDDARRLVLVAGRAHPTPASSRVTTPACSAASPWPRSSRSPRPPGRLFGWVAGFDRGLFS